MKLEGLTVRQLAAVVGEALEQRGFKAILSGGSCVTIYTAGRPGTYVSKDLDFIVVPQARQGEVDAALRSLGFRPEGRVYVHPDTDIAVDVGGRWPLAVGRQILAVPLPRKVAGRRLRMLSSTDCVKDRLAAFFHWADRQALEQAILVCCAQRVDLREVARWARAEGAAERYREFRRALAARSRRPQVPRKPG